MKEDSLLSVAKEFGFDENEAKSFIDNQQENVRQKALMWSNKGISGKYVYDKTLYHLDKIKWKPLSNKPFKLIKYLKF